MLTCPTLIGRQRELSVLRALIERKRSGAGPAILISGEAGIGKSRLMAEARIAAAHQGFLLLGGQCFERDCTVPYAPLLDLFRSYFARFAATGLPDGLHAFVSTLSRLLPDLALLFPDLPTSPALPPADPQVEKRRLFAATTHFLTEQAAHQPVFLVVDDVHWADDLTLDFLLHLARRSQHLPLLLLVTYRSDVLHPGLRQWLGQLDRERLTQEVTLGPLSHSEINAMVRAMLAREDAVDAEVVDTLTSLSEGNPFFVEELLKSLMAAGESPFVEETWVRRLEQRDASRRPFIPRSVQDAVHQRADRLGAEAKRVLTLAAVAGRRFDFPLLQQALHCDEGHLLSLLKELIAAQLVVEESADQFAFRHTLTREAIYSELLVRERRAVHKTLAEALEQLSTSAAMRERYLGDLAVHCYDAGMWEHAIVYAHDIGARALTLYAQRAAIDHFTRALDAAQHVPGPPPSKVYHARGQAYGLLGEFDRAQSDYTRALELAHAAPDGWMEWQCMMALGVLWSERDYAQAGAWFRQALEQASRLAEVTLQTRSLNRLGNWLVNTGRIEEGLQAHQAALKMCEEQHDVQGMAESLDLLGTAYGMCGDRVKAVEQVGQAIALFRSLGDTPSLISSLAMRAVQSMPGSSETSCCPFITLDACVQDASESLRLARQIELPAEQAFAENALAHIFLSFGEFGPAFSHAQEASRVATEIGHQQWMVAASYALGRLYVLLLAPALAMPILQAGLSQAQDLGSAFWMSTLTALQGRAYILQHDLCAAQTALQAVMPREQQPRNIAERDVALTWGELALAQGEPGAAFDIADLLLTSAPGRVPGQSTQPIPHLMKLKGEALLGLGRQEEAAATLEEARRGAVERNTRPVLWIIHRALGQTYRLLHREDRAQQAWFEARQLIEELAATVTDISLRDAFFHTALASFPTEKPLRQRRIAGRLPGGLTAREREVAVLVAQGKTSREIADALVISERTAEVHVSNILKKLGFTSRARIAAWVVERGLLAC